MIVFRALHAALTRIRQVVGRREPACARCSRPVGGSLRLVRGQAYVFCSPECAEADRMMEGP